MSTIQFTHHHNDKSFTLTDPPPGRPAWSGVAPEVLWPPLVSPLTDTRQDWRTPRVLMINIGHKLTRRETGGNKRNWPSLTYPLFLDHSIYHPILRATNRRRFGGFINERFMLGRRLQSLRGWMWAVVSGARAPGTAHLSSQPGSEAGGRLCLASISALSLLSTQPLLVTTKTRPRAHQASEHTYQRKKKRQYVNINFQMLSFSKVVPS